MLDSGGQGPKTNKKKVRAREILLGQNGGPQKQRKEWMKMDLQACDRALPNLLEKEAGAMTR